MFDALPSSLKDVASTITFLLPGFLAVSMFEITNPSLARDRLPLQWTMWSLATSLLIYSAFYGFYSWMKWPRELLDYEFYVPLILGSIVIGWSFGRLAATRKGRSLTKGLKLFIRAWVWVEVLSDRVKVKTSEKLEEQARYVVVYMKDGPTLFGYPFRYTDDRREEVREIYLTEVQRMNAETKKFEPIPNVVGLLVASDRISHITFLATVEELANLKSGVGE